MRNKRMSNAISEHLKIDKDDYQVRNIVNRIYHNILRDYIAHANEREVLDGLYKFYTESDLTLINKKQLKIYQEYEKLATIDKRTCR